MSSVQSFEDLEFSSEIDVRLIRSMADDSAVVQAAQVSVKGENNPGTDSYRLINYLMKNRHGSPFEHAVFTFFVEAPLFVFREWQRHRISSFNEMSGRYSKMKPKFYIPSEDRKLINVGSSARPEFEAGTEDQYRLVLEPLRETSFYSWEFYEKIIDSGVANEVARAVLPLNTYSQMYWTVNARSLMNFLSLRVDSKDATFRSRPQAEIQMAAEIVEEYFKNAMPYTHKAFVNNGRIAP